MEKLLQYAWQHRFWKSPHMTTTDNRNITVLDPGWINHTAGPDFFNSKIIIDGEEWAGNIEIHTRASDWYRHNHHTDPAYNNVILHVVQSSDMHVKNALGTTIPQLIFPCDSNLHHLYNRLLTDPPTTEPLCATAIPHIPPLHLNSWIDSLAYERLYDKTDRFRHYLTITSGDYEQALFTAIARALGFGRNSDSLELAALSTPLRILSRHSDSLPTLEAIIFGQAALIPPPQPTENPYVTSLRNEYTFMAHKFGLTPPRSINWNLGRIRPQNLPHRRLATLAQMTLGGFRYFSRILEATTLPQLRDIFRITLTGYWATATTMNNPLGATPTPLSENAIDSLIINAIVPALHTFGTERNDPAIIERSLDILRALPPENNTITRTFARSGIKCDNAYTSQALIQLHRIYCENRKCLYCRIGYRMLRQK